MAKIVDFKIDSRLDDVVQHIIDEIAKHPTWTTVRISAFDRLCKLLEDEKYIFFDGDFRSYGLQTKGASALYRVPLGQRGALKPFAGKCARVICVGYSMNWPGYSGRQFAAGEVHSFDD